jgi:hypothetical protein
MFDMRRREFITLLGGATVAWPLAGAAQQPEKIRRIGVLMGAAEADPISLVRIAAFKQRLQEVGWIEGRNLRLDVLWAAGNVDRMRAGAKEIVGLRPDVIVAHTLAPALALQKETHNIPIVFAVVSNPDGAGLVESLTRPGCVYRKLDSAIEVMKAAEQRMRCDASDPLNRAREGRVLVQRTVRSHIVVIAGIGLQNPA